VRHSLLILSHHNFNITIMFYIRIFISLIYELLALIAIAFIVSFIYLFCLHDVDFDKKITLQQLIIWLTWGGYFIFSWRKLGQTISMRAWKLKLVLRDRSFTSLAIRYVKISFFWIFFPINFLAIFYFKNKFLHDIKTNIFITDAQTSSLRK
jgi:uncharacterized RDD family membrane protein YckC